MGGDGDDSSGDGNKCWDGDKIFYRVILYAKAVTKAVMVRL